MRALALVLSVAIVGCGDATAPVVEDECRSAGEVESMSVNGVKVDSSLVLEYTFCPVRETYQLPLETPHEGQ